MGMTPKEITNKRMKRFIKWIADISGVTTKIKATERNHIGEQLIYDAFWFNGGVVYKDTLSNISNFATLYGEKLKSGEPISIGYLRDNLYKMEQQGLSVYNDREVYGYWSDTKEPHFIKKEDYNGEDGYTPKLRIKFK